MGNVLEIDLARRRSAFTTKPMASLGLHALARRFERGRRTCDANVLADLVVIAGFRAEGGGPFAIPVSAGRWVGRPCEITHNGKQVLVNAVRTFLDGDDDDRDDVAENRRAACAVMT